MQSKIKRALKLYPFYEATCGDLVFFSLVATLFYIQVKGFSAAQIATIIMIADIADLALEYPTYRAVRILGNSRSLVIGAVMPLIGIILITFGQGILLMVAGRIFFVSAGNFQSMAGAAARNNLELTGEKKDYAKLFSKGITIYSALSIGGAVIVPVLFSVNKYIPSVLCIITFALTVCISFLIPDYTERGGGLLPASEKEKKPRVKIGKGLWLLIVVFCLFFCSGFVFSNNTEIFLTNRLEILFTEQKTIFIYGAVMWAERIVRLGFDVFLPKILDRLNDRIIILSASTMMIAFLVIGISGLAAGENLIPVVLAGIAYVIVKGIIWDPLRTYLRMIAVDSNSRNKQQSMLVLLNTGQSVMSLVMDLIVIGILNALSMEYVFITFALISFVTFICAVKLRRELKNSVRILHYEFVLNETETDKISRRIYDVLKNAGLNPKEALSYGSLTEEKLIESMNEGMRNKRVTLNLNVKFNDFHVGLKIGDQEKDIFTLPVSDDFVSNHIFQNFFKNM